MVKIMIISHMTGKFILVTSLAGTYTAWPVYSLRNANVEVKSAIQHGCSLGLLYDT